MMQRILTTYISWSIKGNRYTSKANNSNMETVLPSHYRLHLKEVFVPSKSKVYPLSVAPIFEKMQTF